MYRAMGMLLNFSCHARFTVPLSWQHLSEDGNLAAHCRIVLPNVQVCDARDDDISSKARLKKILSANF